MNYSQTKAKRKTASALGVVLLRAREKLLVVG
jgi:hypothetical protein